uniref:Transposase n=1 Tax=Elaeophora elaphi TaxID=1147741 RepID=A0A0R3S4U8_9BILA
LYKFEAVIKSKIAVLRKFVDKKKLCAGDPQNLHKLYEEEWKRIENLTTGRRRQPSQLTSNNSTMQISAKSLKSFIS